MKLKTNFAALRSKGILFLSRPRRHASTGLLLRQRGRRRLLLPLLLSWLAAAQAADPSIAFYYGKNPPLRELRAFDIAVVDPDHVASPPAADPGGVRHELFAYVSVGEVHPTRAYFADLPKQAIRGQNQAWNSYRIDQTTPQWREFFLSRIVTPLWQRGWRGFFLDTLDAYHGFASDEAQRNQQVAALVGLLQEFKRRYPDARLILNRGFKLLPQVAPLIYAVAAESLYQGYDAGTKRYAPVAEDDREWLLNQLRAVRERYRLPAIAIDYVDPNKPGARELARQTAKRIRAHGFIPWVTNGGLDTIGVGSVELIPRTVLVVINTNNKIDWHVTPAQRFLGMPLNYLGLRYEFVDLATEPLPQGPLSDRYAGIVTWLDVDTRRADLGPWVERRIAEGLRVVIFNGLGFAHDSHSAKALGLQAENATSPARLTVRQRDERLMGFELEPLPNRDQAVPIRVQEGNARTILQLEDEDGNRYDAAAITQWGGYVLAPFGVVTLPLSGDVRWVVQPIAFLREALALPELPVPDVTTEAGRRMLLVHIDGDGFASRAELPGTPFAGDVLRTEFIDRYRLPTTLSVIEGEIGPQGHHAKQAGRLEAMARRLFALPHVEGATHTFSHPLIWARAVQPSSNLQHASVNADSAYALEVPNYQFNLDRELKGSIDYINRRLMPKGKTASVVLWTGDCVLPSEVIASAYRHGLLAMNGGDTTITQSSKTWTAIAPLGVPKPGGFQVFAPIQNENVYSNLWREPFYGYERVIETFHLTGEPYRIKPINIYYHVYSATKPASIHALHKVYRWAQAQRVSYVYGSEYIRKVLDFQDTTLARDIATNDLIVRTGKALRTLRLPKGGAAPSLLASLGVAGVAAGPDGDYLTLAAPEARLVAADRVEHAPYIAEANGMVSEWSRALASSGQTLRFMLRSHGKAEFTLAHASACQVVADGTTIRPLSQASSKESAIPMQLYRLGSGEMPGSTRNHAVLVRCPALPS